MYHATSICLCGWQGLALQPGCLWHRSAFVSWISHSLINISDDFRMRVIFIRSLTSPGRCPLPLPKASDRLPPHPPPNRFPDRLLFKVGIPPRGEGNPRPPRVRPKAGKKSRPCPQGGHRGRRDGPPSPVGRGSGSDPAPCQRQVEWGFQSGTKPPPPHIRHIRAGPQYKGTLLAASERPNRCASLVFAIIKAELRSGVKNF